MKRLFFLLLISVWLLFFFYLLLPEPQAPSALPNSLKSQDPGDTIEIPGVSAYYTDILRKEVVRYYAGTFSHSPFLDLPLITYRLNHPPEKIKELLKKPQKASYVEEIVHPLKSSLFVAGYEWENDPFVPENERERHKIFFEGKTFRSKVTLYYQKSPPLAYIFVFLGISFATWLVGLAFLRIYDSFRHHRQL